jgi:multimeric flavodoxin WrbA
MNALILNGAHPGDAELDRVEEAVRRELVATGLRARSLVLHRTPIAYCQGCFECWTKTPGVCKTNDAGREVAAAFIASHLVVFLTPVTFGGYSSELKKALDRIIGLVTPFFVRIDGESHHRARYERYPALLALGVLPEPQADDERIFHTLVQRNAINMHAPWHASRVVYRGDAEPATHAAIRPILAAQMRAA